MNKDGFTLVELLGVIVILAILSGLAVLSYSSIIATGKKGIYLDFEKNLDSATRNYLMDNMDEIPLVGHNRYVFYDELITNNYIDKLTDPNGGVCDGSFVEIKRGSDVSNNLNLDYKSCLICKDTNNNYTYKSDGCDSIYTKDECFTYTINNNQAVITDYDASCGKDLIIPLKINDYKVTTISANAFKASQIENVVIPDGVTTIGYEAFRSNLITKVVIPKTVTTIEENAFLGNNLASIKIPNSVTVINSGAFFDNKLTRVEIPNGVITIGESAFRNNPLISVVIPSSVISWKCNAFPTDTVIDNQSSTQCN